MRTSRSTHRRSPRLPPSHPAHTPSRGWGSTLGRRWRIERLGVAVPTTAHTREADGVDDRWLPALQAGPLLGLRTTTHLRSQPPDAATPPSRRRWPVRPELRVHQRLRWRCRGQMSACSAVISACSMWSVWPVWPGAGTLRNWPAGGNRRRYRRPPEVDPAPDPPPDLATDGSGEVRKTPCSDASTRSAPPVGTPHPPTSTDTSVFAILVTLGLPFRDAAKRSSPRLLRSSGSHSSKKVLVACELGGRIG